MVIELSSVSTLVSLQQDMGGLKTLFVRKVWLCCILGPESFNFTAKTGAF